MSRKRIPLNQNGCTANFRIGVPFEQNLQIGGKTAILGRDGTLKVGKTEEIITEKKLEELYQVKTRIVYIPEVGRKVCVVAEQ